MYRRFHPQTNHVNEPHQQLVAAPDFRHWLAERSDSERATLARLWKVALHAPWPAAALADAVLQPATVGARLASLSGRERATLEQVQAGGGRIAALRLEREYGRIRDHDTYANPRAYLAALEGPPSPVERLYTLGMLQHIKLHGERWYVVPPDLLALLPPVPLRERHVRLDPAAMPLRITAGEARIAERHMLVLLGAAHDGVLATTTGGAITKAGLTLLARQWSTPVDLGVVRREHHWPSLHALHSTGLAAGLLRVASDGTLRPTREALDWMRLPAGERSQTLLDGWLEADWDELAQLGGLVFRRAYSRNLLVARRGVLRLLGELAASTWFALDALIAAVHDVDPDFARPSGNYDDWGIQNRFGVSLDGYDNWEVVEGEQLRLMITRSLHWLGLIDLGQHGEQMVFRINALGAMLLGGAAPPAMPPEEPLLVQPTFEVLVPPYASPYARFQVGRVAQLVRHDALTVYQLTRKSVQAAQERNIGPDEIVRFLEEQSRRPVPQNVAATIREWADQHGRLRLRRAVLLQSNDPVLLEQVRRDRRVKVPPTEPLSETTWLLREGDAPALAERLRKAGYGLAGDAPPAAPLSEHDLTVLFAALEFYAEAAETLGITTDASKALRNRVGRLLPETSANRAYKQSQAALDKLKQRID